MVFLGFCGILKVIGEAWKRPGQACARLRARIWPRSSGPGRQPSFWGIRRDLGPWAAPGRFRGEHPHSRVYAGCTQGNAGMPGRIPQKPRKTNGNSKQNPNKSEKNLKKSEKYVSDFFRCFQIIFRCFSDLFGFCFEFPLVFLGFCGILPGSRAAGHPGGHPAYTLE